MRSWIRAIPAAGLLGACSGDIATPNGSSGIDANDPTVATQPNASIGPASEAQECAAAPRRIWKLTPSQYQATLTATGLPEADGIADEFFVPERAEHGFRGAAENLEMSTPVVEQLFKAATELGRVAEANPAELAPCFASGIAPNCVSAFLEDLAATAFRRPATAQELERFLGFFFEQEAAFGGHVALRQVIRTLLMSPSALYRYEWGAPDPTTPGAFVLNSQERASALAYWLTDAPPDRELAAAPLSSPEQIEEQVRRLLASPAGVPGIRKMFTELLQLEGFAQIEKDSGIYQSFDATLAADLLEATQRFIEHALFREDGRLATLLTTEQAMVNGRTAPVFGASLDPESGFQWAALPAGQRAGLLTQPALMARLANDKRSDIIRRGIFIREHILCEELPPPPPTVNAVPILDVEGLSQREELAQHRNDPTCAACHELFDPVGYAFEHFDALGQFQHTDDGRAIDASGTLALSDGRTIEFSNAVELGAVLSGLPRVQACMARHFFRYATGRVETESDTCRMDRLRTALAESDGNLVDLIVNIATSDLFFVRASAQE